MKKIIYKISFLALLGIFITSCEKEDVNPTSNNVINNNSISKPNAPAPADLPENSYNYQDLELLVSNQLNDIAQNLRDQNSNFNSQVNVNDAADQTFSGNALGNFQTYYSSTLNKEYESYEYNANVSNVLNSIQQNLTLSNDAQSFITALDVELNNVLASDLNANDKDLLVKHIATHKVAILFMQNNQDIISIGQEGWWGSWGKCAASVLGGAGLGALGGGAAGSAIPGLGTAAGAIIGGIAGGLSGAGAGC